MELKFQQVEVPYLQSVLFETVLQEESGEAIVPDRLPDMERIVDAFASAVLRGKDVAGGTLSLTGDIQAGALYMAGQEEAPQQISLYLPFSLRRTVPEEDCQCTVQCRVRSVEARMLNSRKLSIRVGLCIVLQVWRSCTQTCYRPEQPPRRVQMKHIDYPMRLPVESTERSLLLRETLPLPSACPEAAKLLFTDARCQITDEKLSGDKAVCKGNLCLRVLYETPEGTLASCELAVPFSQFIPLAGDYEEGGLVLLPQLTSLEASAAGENIELEAGIVMQCCVMQVCSVPLVADAYATKGRLQAERCNYGMQQQLDQRIMRQELRQELPVTAMEIVHAEAMPDAPQVQWSDGASKVRVPLQLSVLYRDSAGALQSTSRRCELEMEVPSAKASCQALAWADGPVFASPGAGCIEVRLPLAVQCTWYGESVLCSIFAATLEEEAETAERPAVIIRTLEEDCPMWELAKELRTTVSAIQIANDMDADIAPAGTMLLIPIVA